MSNLTQPRNTYSPVNSGGQYHAPVTNGRNNLDEHYSGVMMWLFIAFTIAAVSTVFIGPLIPPGIAGMLSIALLAVLLITSFVRAVSPVMSTIMVIAVPTIIGIILYPTLNSRFASGSGDTVWLALSGTAIVFGTMAVWGWKSTKDTRGWGSKLFVILLAVIVLSLLNTFVFHVAGIGLLISIVTLVLFSFYTFYDIQRMRDKSYGDAPASVYALNIFLDIVNIFTSILNLTR